MTQEEIKKAHELFAEAAAEVDGRTYSASESHPIFKEHLLARQSAENFLKTWIELDCPMYHRQDADGVAIACPEIYGGEEDIHFQGLDEASAKAWFKNGKPMREVAVNGWKVLIPSFSISHPYIERTTPGERTEHQTILDFLEDFEIEKSRSIAHWIAFNQIRDAIKPFIVDGIKPGVIGIHVVGGTGYRFYFGILSDVITTMKQVFDEIDDVAVMFGDVESNILMDDAQKKKLLLLICSDADAKNAPFYCDDMIEISKPSVDIIMKSAVAAEYIPPTYEQAEEIAKYKLTDIQRCFRHHRPIDRSIEMLEFLSLVKYEDEKKDAAPKKKIELASAFDLPTDAPTVEELHGYGAAKEWALDLKQDLEDYRAGLISWADIDRGILLHGAPGCGKTVFAQAIAKSVGAKLYLGSYGIWAAGQGQTDLLKRMRGCFEAAKANAPAIIFIDEIDSFTDRDKAADWHAQWSREVTNSLLECIDGGGGREGVIIIGACNNPAIIDPAILRAGRLDKNVKIELPILSDRVKIAEFHLKGHSVSGLEILMKHTQGWSGADIEQMCRSARRVARRRRESITIDHLRAAFPPMKKLSADELRSVALHEAGHAIAAWHNGFEIDEIVINDEVLADRQTSAGFVAWHAPEESAQDTSSFAGMMQTTLAGVAAEQIQFGPHSAGCLSDLQFATVLGFKMLFELGFGNDLTSIGQIGKKDMESAIKKNPELRKRINEVLQSQLAKAKDILREREREHMMLVEALLEVKSMTGAQMRAIIERPKLKLVEGVSK